MWVAAVWTANILDLKNIWTFSWKTVPILKFLNTSFSVILSSQIRFSRSRLRGGSGTKTSFFPTAPTCCASSQIKQGRYCWQKISVILMNKSYLNPPFQHVELPCYLACIFTYSIARAQGIPALATFYLRVHAFSSMR